MGSKQSAESAAEAGGEMVVKAAAGAVVDKVSGGGDGKKKRRDDDSDGDDDGRATRKSSDRRRRNRSRDRERRRRRQSAAREPTAADGLPSVPERFRPPASSTSSGSDDASHRERWERRLRRRRDNYRRDLEEEQARAKVRADKAGCCGGGSSDEEEVPYNPGSEYSDANYYVSSEGVRHRRQPGGAANESSTESEESVAEERGGVVPAVAPSSPGGQSLVEEFVTLESMTRTLIDMSESDERGLLHKLNAADQTVVMQAHTAADVCAMLFTSHLPPANQSAIAAYVVRQMKTAEATAAAEGGSSPVVGSSPSLSSPNRSRPHHHHVGNPKTPLSHGGVVVDLGGMQLGDDCAYLIARLLRHADSAARLTEMSLASVGLTDHGAEVLAAAMTAAEPPYWTRIDLSGNPRLTMRGATRVLAALEALYPKGYASQFDRHVSFAEDDAIWLSPAVARTALEATAARLAAQRVMVELPPVPPDLS